MSVIKLTDGKLLTTLKQASFLSGQDFFAEFKKQNILHAAVFNRHSVKMNFANGFVKGMNIQAGAIAITVAHDCHNVIVIGDNSSDMAVAVSALIACGGGQVVVGSGKVIGLLPLPIAVIISDKSAKQVSTMLTYLKQAAKIIGITFSAPFVTLLLLALPTILQARLTNL